MPLEIVQLSGFLIRSASASSPTFATSRFKCSISASSSHGFGMCKNVVAIKVIPQSEVKIMIGTVLCSSATSGAKIVTKLPIKSPKPRAETAKTLGNRSKLDM